MPSSEVQQQLADTLLAHLVLRDQQPGRTAAGTLDYLQGPSLRLARRVTAKVV